MDYLAELRDGHALSFKQLLILTMQLSLPAILAQISTVVMQYIDASMVGSLGANQSAAIGLVSSSTWLFSGVITAISVGFSVQVAQLIGAKDEVSARLVTKHGLCFGLILSCVLSLIGVLISPHLPVWLSGAPAIRLDSSRYFMVFTLSLPCILLTHLSSSMIQCSGNMRLPGVINMLMCLLDVIYNSLLIFPTRTITLFHHAFTIPGAHLGVLGAALGTALAQLSAGLVLAVYLLFYSPSLHLRSHESFHFNLNIMTNAVKLGLPVGIEQIIMCLAYIFSIRIVAPLGVTAIAAHSFSITAESLCYMPGYGIGAAATTLIGQSVGAKRFDLTRQLAWMTTMIGALIMSLTGGLMFVFSYQMISFLTPDMAIRQLGMTVLRIEAFAEPMYGASIVATGALRGAGDTFHPSLLNFLSMWLIRLPLSLILSHTLGLKGVWLAMCFELWVRGILFLFRLKSRGWLENASKQIIE